MIKFENNYRWRGSDSNWNQILYFKSVNYIIDWNYIGIIVEFSSDKLIDVIINIILVSRWLNLEIIIFWVE